MSISLNKPDSLVLTEAMFALGIFTFPGIKAIAEIWGTTDFTDDSGSREDNLELIGKLVDRLHEEGIEDDERMSWYLSESRPDAYRVLYDFWQLPMYNLDLRSY